MFEVFGNYVCLHGTNLGFKYKFTLGRFKHNPTSYGQGQNVYHDQGRPQDLGGRGQEFFLRFGNLHVAKPCALLGGFGGMFPR